MPNYSGTWSLPAQMQAIGSGNWPVNGPFPYIEDVFSTYLYTGNGSNLTVTNNIDLSTKGGMVWVKNRTTATFHNLIDTARGVDKYIQSNSTNAQQDGGGTGSVTAFNTNGFAVGNFGTVNTSSDNYASWTFAKQEKFFDVVTYTGNGSVQNIAHSLGSAPGCVIVKCTSAGGTGWAVYHRMLNGGTNPANYLMLLQSTSAQFASSTVWNNTAPTSTQFTVGTDLSTNGATYVAYLFAHDAGGFGTAGTDNVISCGSWTTTGSVQNINIGYEPQWLLIKKATGTIENWSIIDNMRGATADRTSAILSPNATSAESSVSSYIGFNSTGFSVPSSGVSNTYIYIAIRRGPMKTPTDGTKVFSPVARTGNGGTATVTAGFAPDLYIGKDRNDTWSADFCFTDRLRGTNVELFSNDTSSELSGTSFSLNTIMTGVTFNGSGLLNGSGASFINYFLKRAPGFFDEVCYTGTGSATTVTHNLGVAPELVIVKSRSVTVDWITWNAYSTPQQNQYQISLNTAGTWSSSGDKYWGSTTTGTPSMTSTTFSLGDAISVNGSGSTYVAYLFASCAGVSKVGSYTGTGTTQQINCGFTGGARFVLIKRTDSTGDWYVWDTARGIVAGNDPYLLLNSTAAEVTNTDYVDTYAAGFEITSTAPAAINANGGSFIFLAIA